MSYIPDCRNDAVYNQKYLNAQDKQFVAGYDWAVDRIMTLFDNIEVYPDLDAILDDKMAIIEEGKADIVKSAVEEWAESGRDDLITSMIDNMSEDEYAKIKAEVDSEK